MPFTSAIPYKITAALILTLCILNTGCKRGKPAVATRERISFKSVEGIYYTEVDRRAENGLSFNEYGYHLKPEWRLRFVSFDSAALYSPVKKEFVNFPLALGMDSIFTTVRAFLKVRKMSKDSLIFEMLEVKNDSLKVGGSRVFMKFYADDYIKNKLHTTADKLIHATRKDSAYVKSLAAKANADIKKAFAAQQPVQFIAKSKNLTVEKFKNKPNYLENNFNTTDDYMDPTYTIKVANAFKDFNYYFSAYVDAQGKMHYRRPLMYFLGDKDFEQHYIKMSTAVMNSYVTYYFDIIPGQTLGIPHASMITMRVIGKKAAK